MRESQAREAFNKVPFVTLYFWIIKILATTVGETGADFLNMDMGLGLTLTSVLMALVLAAVLAIQFRSRHYVPWRYWLVVVFLSIVGTLITDLMTDNLGVDLRVSTAIFTVALIFTFVAWHRREGTLSIHDIDTPQREAFYWAAILFTFALGTAGGDLASEQIGLGYLTAALIFGGAIAVITVAYFAKVMGPVLAFWLAYILTRPLGASIGDLVTQPRTNGGLGFATMPVSGVFLVIIVALVIYLSRSGIDQPKAASAAGNPDETDGAHG